MTPHLTSIKWHSLVGSNWKSYCKWRRHHLCHDVEQMSAFNSLGGLHDSLGASIKGMPLVQSVLFKAECYRLLLIYAHHQSCLMEPDLLRTIPINSFINLGNFSFHTGIKKHTQVLEEILFAHSCWSQSCCTELLKPMCLNRQCIFICPYMFRVLWTGWSLGRWWGTCLAF